MSEQKKLSYMEQLDLWIDQEVFENLYAVWTESQDGNMDASSSRARKAIKDKVLESYRNGQKAGQPNIQVRRAK